MNPESLQIHCVPQDWEDPSSVVDNDELPFESIDNPGEWSIVFPSDQYLRIWQVVASQSINIIVFQMDAFQLRI